MVCHRFRIRKSWSLIIITVTLVTLFLLLPAQILFSNYKRTMLEEMSKRALAIANTTAKLLALDSLPYIELTSALQDDPKSFDKQYYTKMHTLFIKLRKDTGVDYLYSQYQQDDTTCMVVLDSQEQEDSLFPFSPPGSLVAPWPAGCCETFRNTASLSTGIIGNTRREASIFAHAPIIDIENGTLIGVVTTGFSLATLEQNMRNMFYLILFLFILIAILVSLALCIVLKLREHSLDVEYLTKLGTKKFFENQLTRVADHAKASSTEFSLLMLDIDGFKLINDTYGHLTGDGVLQAVASIIRSIVQATDICSRIGGDEFAIILTTSPLEQALSIAQCIQEAIQDHLVEGCPELELSVSIGVAQWDRSNTIQELIEQADQALYKAKNLGKNTVTRY